MLELEMLPHAHRKRNKWLLPSHMREIPYLPVSEMDFTSAKKKHELMVEKQVTPMATRSNPGIQNARTPVTTSEEQKMSFFTSISGSTVRPAVLSLITPFNEQYILVKKLLMYRRPCPIAYLKKVISVGLHRVAAAVSTNIA